MSRRFEDAVYAFIKSRAIAGESGRQIWRELTAGEAPDRDPIKIGIRTVQGLAAQYKREHQQAGAGLDTASLPTAAETERMLLLAEVRRRREAASKLRDTDPQAIKLLTACARFLDTFERNYARAENAKSGKTISHGGTPKKATTLELLGESMRDRGLEDPASSDLPLTDTNGEADNVGDPGGRGSGNDEEEQGVERVSLSSASA